MRVIRMQEMISSTAMIQRCATTKSKRKENCLRRFDQANDLRNLHGSIVHDDGELVSGNGVVPPVQEVT